MRMGKSLLNYKWSFGSDTIMLTKVLLRYIAKESSVFQIFARGKYRFYNCIGHTVQPTCKLNSTPQQTYPPNQQINIVSLHLLRQDNFVLSNKCFTMAKVVYACPVLYVQNCHSRRNRIRV